MLEPPINHEICDFCNGGSLMGHLLRQRFKVILDMGVEPKIWGKPPKSSIFIGFSMK